MALVSIVDAFCEKELDETALKIEAEMKAVVARHWKSGDAYRAIHIERPSKFVRLIGGTGGEGTKHLVWLDQGNRPNGSDGRIHPTRHRMLRITDGRGNTVAFANSVSTYAGIHFLKEIASKYQ